MKHVHIIYWVFDDYVNNKELSVQEAIRLGILDKQNGQYINRKTNEIFSISEAITQGHIRASTITS